MSEKEFINQSVSSLLPTLKIFPTDFIGITNKRVISVPKKNLIIGNEFFGNYEILTVDGANVYSAKNYEEAKFIVYSSRQSVSEIILPDKDEDVKKAIIEYEKYLNGILQELKSNYKKTFPSEKNFSIVSNEIFRKLNLIRY